ncbi:MAG: hypothetical protein R3C60_14090 [Parvularculaceae bacterium]
MTGNLAIDLAISLGGIILMVAVSYFLGAWRTVKIDAAAAADRLSFDEPDFKPATWRVSSDGLAAAAASVNGGETALVFVLGDGLASRRFRSGAAPVRQNGRSLVWRLGEPSLPKVTVTAESEDIAADWHSEFKAEGL